MALAAIITTLLRGSGTLRTLGSQRLSADTCMGTTAALGSGARKSIVRIGGKTGTIANGSLILACLANTPLMPREVSAPTSTAGRGPGGGGGAAQLPDRLLFSLKLAEPWCELLPQQAIDGRPSAVARNQEDQGHVRLRLPRHLD